MQRMPNSIAIMSKMPSDAKRVLLHRGEGNPLIIMAKPPSVHRNVKESVHQRPRTIPTNPGAAEELLGAGAPQPDDMGWLKNCRCHPEDREDYGCECGAEQKWFEALEAKTPRAEILAKYGVYHYGGDYGKGYREDDLYLPETWIVWDGASGGNHGMGANKFRWLCPTDEWGPDYDVVAPAIPNLWQHGYLCMRGNKPACHHEMWEEYWRSKKNDHIDPRRRTDRNETMFNLFVEKWKREVKGEQKKTREPNPAMKWRHPWQDKRDRIDEGFLIDNNCPIEWAMLNGGLTTAPIRWYEEGINPELLYPKELAEHVFFPHPEEWDKQRRRSPRSKTEMAADEKFEQLYHKAYKGWLKRHQGTQAERHQRRFFWQKVLDIQAKRQQEYNRRHPKVRQWGPKQWRRQLVGTVKSLERDIYNREPPGRRDFATLHAYNDPRIQVWLEHRHWRAAKKWQRAGVFRGVNDPEEKRHREKFTFGCKEIGFEYYVKLAMQDPPDFLTEEEALAYARKIVSVTMKRESLIRRALAVKSKPTPRKDDDWQAALEWGKNLRDNTEEWGKNLTAWGHRPERFEDLTGVRMDELEEIPNEQFPSGFHILAQEVYQTYDGECTNDELWACLVGSGAFRGLVEQGVDPEKFAWTYKNGAHAVGMVLCARFNGDFYTEFDGVLYKGVLQWRGSWGLAPQSYDEVLKSSTFAITWGVFDPEDEEAA